MLAADDVLFGPQWDLPGEGDARLGQVVVLATLGAEPVAALASAGSAVIGHPARILAVGTGPEPFVWPNVLDLLSEQV